MTKEGHHVTDLCLANLNRNQIPGDLVGTWILIQKIWKKEPEIPGPLMSSQVIQTLLPWFSVIFFNKIVGGGVLVLIHRTVVLNSGDLVSGEFGTVWRHFCLHKSGGTTGVMWIGPRDAAKYNA